MNTLLKTVNILVLLGSLALISLISIEFIASGVEIPYSVALKVQGGVCVIFLLDYIIRFINSSNKIRFFFYNILFLLVSIPYTNIITALNVDLTPLGHLAIRFAPLLRGGYGLIIMVRWVAKSNITTLFVTYLVTIFSTTYFCSLLFYVMERDVNEMVKSYWDALWWAMMDMTTVGSNIYAMTTTGQVLSVVLAAAGMMMFPIFTVYITEKFKR